MSSTRPMTELDHLGRDFEIDSLTLNEIHNSHRVSQGRRLGQLPLRRAARRQPPGRQADHVGARLRPRRGLPHHVPSRPLPAPSTSSSRTRCGRRRSAGVAPTRCSAGSPRRRDSATSPSSTHSTSRSKSSRSGRSSQTPRSSPTCRRSGETPSSCAGSSDRNEKSCSTSEASFQTLLGDRARRRFRGIYDHHYRLVESLDASRGLLASILDTYRSAVAERMNEVMKVLTVYTAILLPLSLMAGLYGMNFANIPELQWRWGYFALLGIMGALAIGQWIYFSRRGFIGGPSLRKMTGVVGKGLALVTLAPVRSRSATCSTAPPATAGAARLKGSPIWSRKPKEPMTPAELRPAWELANPDCIRRASSRLWSRKPKKPRLRHHVSRPARQRDRSRNHHRHFGGRAVAHLRCHRARQLRPR